MSHDALTDLRPFGGRLETVLAGAASPDAGALWNFGWHDRPQAVAAVLATLPFPTYEACAQNLTGSGAGKTVLLSDAAKLVYGRHLPAQQQPRGTCVSRGYSRAVDYLQCVQIVQGQAQELRFVSHAAVYGFAREIGHGLGAPESDPKQDGAVGAWAARAVSAWGVVTNDDVQDVDAGSDTLAVHWGSVGCPASVKALAKDHLCKAATQVSTPEQARDMIANGYPVPVCSQQGFTTRRDATGRCQPQGVWAHCMMWSGYRDDRRQFLVEQSWGQQMPSGPLGDLDIPDNAFWIDWQVAASMLGMRDSFALSGFDGFPAQSLSWLI